MDLKRINAVLDAALEIGGTVVSVGILITAGIIIGSVTSE